MRIGGKLVFFTIWVRIPITGSPALNDINPPRFQVVQKKMPETNAGEFCDV